MSKTHFFGDPFFGIPESIIKTESIITKMRFSSKFSLFPESIMRLKVLRNSKNSGSWIEKFS